MNRWALGGKQQTVLCCSSTRHRRFIDDLVNVMALPDGCRVRLRYGKKHCDDVVRAMGEQPSVANISILIAHVRFVDGKAHFLPLRTGRLVEIKTQGTVTYLDVELKDFVQGLPAQSFADALQSSATKPLPHIPADDDVPSGAFCQLLDHPPPMTTGSGSLLWEQVAESFLDAIKGSSAEFPYVYQVEVLERTSSGTRRVPIRAGMLLAPSISRIEIQIRTLVDRSLFNTVIDRPVGTIKVAVEHPELSLISRDTLCIDTTRNLMTSRLTAKLGIRAAYGSLTIAANRSKELESPPGGRDAAAADEQKQEDATPTTPAKRVVDEIITELPVTVGRSWVRWGAAIALAFAAAAHKFDLRAYDVKPDEVWIQAVAVFFGVLVALWLGVKPQSGS